MSSPFLETSLQGYITGKTALNIPAPECTSGDWHFRPTFESPSSLGSMCLAGEGLKRNTN